MQMIQVDPRPPFSIGLTGGIGSGKSAVADLFAQRGAAIIDTDLIAHALTAPGGQAIPAIRAAFGDAFITAEGALDRAAMRAKVFAEPDARRALEAILHPQIREQTEAAALKARGPYRIFVVPLLVESKNWRERVDRILVVDCSENLQIKRVMQRNQFTESQVQAIMNSQASRADRLAAADDIVSNENGFDALELAVERLHRQYLTLAEKK